jgi:hypothetical protein
MGLGPSNLRRHLMSALNYLQIAFSIFAVTQFPGWIKGGYLADDYIPGLPLWVPVGIATFGSLIGGIWWTISRYKRTKKWW